MNKDFFEYFNKCLNEDKLPHAFLIETDDVESLFENIIEYLYEKKMIQTKEYVNNINLVVIEPDGKEIKSLAINNLQKQFMTKSQEGMYNIYIIKYADKMNVSSGNKLLKFLEEPESRILGILLSSNSGVLTTVKSRCQIFKMFDKGENTNLEEETTTLLNLLDNLTIFNEMTLKQTYSKMERYDLIIIVNKLLLKYELLLSNDYDINQLSMYSNIIVVLEEILRLLKSNVNIELVLDKLCIEVKD